MSNIDLFVLYATDKGSLLHHASRCKYKRCYLSLHASFSLSPSLFSGEITVPMATQQIAWRCYGCGHHGNAFYMLVVSLSLSLSHTHPLTFILSVGSWGFTYLRVSGISTDCPNTPIWEMMVCESVWDCRLNGSDVHVAIAVICSVYMSFSSSVNVKTKYYGSPMILWLFTMLPNISWYLNTCPNLW